MQNRRRQKGTVLILVTIALAVMIGMVGLALDSGQLYLTKQQEQATADAAAQAGAMDLFNLNPSQAQTTALAYAQNAGYSNPTCPTKVNCPPNSVNVSYQNCATLVWCNNGKIPVSSDNPNLIEVDITKTVNTTLLRVLNLSASTVTSTAIAGITQVTSAIPMIVTTHPTLSGALSLTGSSSITILGGIQRAIQVNSTDPKAFSPGGSINLSGAGPLGTGGDLAVTGGPNSEPSGIALGSSGHYIQPASMIQDPFLAQTPPLNAPYPAPPSAPAPTALPNGANGCPPSPLQPCQLYSPGTYSAGIHIRNQTAVFKPGIYFVVSGGFTVDVNGSCAMGTGFPADPTTGWTGNMMVYNKLGNFSTTGSFGNCTLVGAPSGDRYHGILFFQDPTAAATHVFAGTGTLSLTGILYMSNPAAVVPTAPTQYQTLMLNGGTINITNGGIIANVLSLNGASLTMTAPIPVQIPNVRQVSLLQ